MDLQNHASFSSYSYKVAYLECLFRTVRITKLVHGVLLLYLVVSSCTTVRKELQSCTQLFHAATIWTSNFWYPFQQRSWLTFCKCKFNSYRSIQQQLHVVIALVHPPRHQYPRCFHKFGRFFTRKYGTYNCTMIFYCPHCCR